MTPSKPTTTGTASNSGDGNTNGSKHLVLGLFDRVIGLTEDQVTALADLKTEQITQHEEVTKCLDNLSEKIDKWISRLMVLLLIQAIIIIAFAGVKIPELLSLLKLMGG